MTSADPHSMPRTYFQKSGGRHDILRRGLHDPIEYVLRGREYRRRRWWKRGQRHAIVGLNSESHAELVYHGGGTRALPYRETQHDHSDAMEHRRAMNTQYSESEVDLSVPWRDVSGLVNTTKQLKTAHKARRTNESSACESME